MEIASVYIQKGFVNYMEEQYLKEYINNDDLEYIESVFNELNTENCELAIQILIIFFNEHNPNLIPQQFLNKYHTDTIQKNNKILSDYLEMSN